MPQETPKRSFPFSKRVEEVAASLQSMRVGGC